jgi:AcrR family transcriptional regulator
MPRGFSERQKDLIRQRLIQQGDKLFSAYGLKKTSVEELARAAGISKGAFYLFYGCKEELFMDVTELAEQRYRQALLSAIDVPGPSARARLVTVLQKAFALLKSVPLLQSLTGSDYDLLFRKISADKLQQHLASDRIFFDEFVTRCREAGIPIRVRSDEISGLLYPLVISILHEDDLGPNAYHGSTDVLLELIAAFCLGEISIHSHKGTHSQSDVQKGLNDGFHDRDL